MTVEADLITRLDAVSMVTDLVGSRVYASQAPQNVTRPFVVFHKLGADRRSAFVSDTGAVRYLFQFDCYAETYDVSISVANALRFALQRYSGNSVHHVFVGSEKTMYNDEGELYRSMIEFIVWYKES